TTVATDQLLVFEGARTSGTFTQPTGMTARASNQVAAQLTGAVADQPLTTAGPTGTRSINFSPSTTGLVAISVALKPAQTTYAYNSRGDRTSITRPTGPVTNPSYH